MTDSRAQGFCIHWLKVACALIALSVAQAQTGPSLFVQLIDVQTCVALEPFIGTCVQRIVAVASNLPANTEAVKFTINYTDPRGIKHVEVAAAVKDQYGDAVFYKAVSNFTDASVTASELSGGSEIPQIP